jgi:NAD(P)-dependent dehydrogenase (short-subunit alcohol dehydrogenase family)
VQTDVPDTPSVDVAVAQVAERFGRIDVVVNNAGIGSIADHVDDDWMRVLSVNVVAIARVTRAALPYLRVSPSAAVVSISSIAATA